MRTAPAIPAGLSGCILAALAGLAAVTATVLLTGCATDPGASANPNGGMLRDYTDGKFDSAGHPLNARVTDGSTLCHDGACDGPIAGGAQYVSWVHEHDFLRAIDWLIADGDVDGAVNLASPNPLPQRAFMRALCDACGAPIALPAKKWMLEAGALVLGVDSELMLKSRRVVPGRLIARGFTFDFPTWPEAARDLVRPA